MNEKVFEHKNWERLVSPEREERLSREKFFEIAKPLENEVWLDLGCGPGYFTLPLAEMVKTVYALDISKEMLDICKMRASELDLNNIEYILSDSEKIDLPDNSVDNILMCNIYHEIDNRKNALKQLYKILKPSGNIYLIDWEYLEMEIGPPLDHRIKKELAIEEFNELKFSFISEYNIFEFEYFLKFSK